MSKLTDSGCREHPPRHIVLTGAAAALVDHLFVNLPMTADGHTYICEHGHTHHLTLEPCDKKVSSSQPALGDTSDKAVTH